jgi:2'-5' RNA ligase
VASEERAVPVTGAAVGPGCGVLPEVPVRRGAQRVGTNSNCAQSALLIPVPEAEAVVGRWRALHDPSARRGVPAHVTLVVPWVAPEQIKQEHLDELAELLADQGPFEYSLEKVSWFGERVLWLGPSPSAPFKRLTATLAGHFDTPPWQGEFDEVVPHLTVGLAGCAVGCTLSEAAEDLRSRLPVKCRATEVRVMCGDGISWELIHHVAL